MTQIVPGYGNRQAKLMILGEAPAAQELRLGRPFVGQAGQELDKLLLAANIQRDDIYITNASLEPVRIDKEKHFFNGGQPTQVYIEGIAQAIKDIQDIRPNVVVTMGNYATWALGQFQQIMSRRGSIYWSDIAGVKFIPTIHPAALLRGKPDEAKKAQGGMYKMRNPVIWDLMKAKNESLYPDYKLTPRTYLVDPVGEERDAAIARLLSAQRLYFDIESWGGTRLACIGFSDGDPGWSVTFSYDPGYSDAMDRMRLFKDLLESDIPKYGQNLMYDVTMLDQNGIHTRNVAYDCMIASHVLMPDLPKSLEFLASVYTDIPWYKAEGKVWDQPKTPEIEAQYYLYNAKDVCATVEVCNKQESELSADNLWPVLQRSMNVFEPLRWATYKGMACDLNKLWKLIDKTQNNLESAQKELNELAGYEINVNSHVQVKKFLYGELKLSNRTNQSSDAQTILDIAARTGNRAPYLIVRARGEQKLLSNYYKTGIISPDGRIRFGFNIVGTFGARISSSAPLWGVGLNGQNIPHEARQMFLPDPGHTLLEFDQAQAEAVIVAYLANDPVHIDCFRNGKDVHRVTACLLQDMDPNDWQKIPKPSAIRELAKTCNHELNYNAGPMQFMMTVNKEYDPDDPTSVKLEFPMAREIRSKYMRTRPALEAYWESIRNELKVNRTLVTPLGRKYQFLDAWSNDLLNKAYSYKPQCTVGETTNMGICQVLGITDLSKEYDERYKLQQEISKFDLEFLLQVHDSTIWQVPDEQVDEVAPLIMKLLEVPLQVNGYNICVAIEGQKGKSWYKKDMDFIGISRETVEL